jgi:transcriptional regulator GlxA family with amidase domain
LADFLPPGLRYTETSKHPNYMKKGQIQMKMAFILFDQITSLDFVGFFDSVTRLKRVPGFEHISWEICAMQEEIRDDRRLKLKATKVGGDLSGFDLLFVPGGMGTRALRYDPQFIAWLQTAGEAKYKVSVCTGALLLGAAAFLDGKRATTNPTAYELLAPYCGEVVKTRIVRDGDVITGGGVAASVDLGLYMVELIAGTDIAKQIQQSMDYPYYEAGKASLTYP